MVQYSTIAMSSSPSNSSSMKTPPGSTPTPGRSNSNKGANTSPSYHYQYQTPQEDQPRDTPDQRKWHGESSSSSKSSRKDKDGQNPCFFIDKFKGWIPDLTVRQWRILVVFAAADFIAGMVYNIKGPFYPHEAETKGVTSSQYGFVFGIFDVTKVFVCPIFGKYMSNLGPRRVFISSMILISICSIAFGMLDYVYNTAAFLTLSLVIRVLEAIGSSAFSTSSFCIIACEFPNTVATTFASLETFFGIGLIVGPLLGGLFYQAAGYYAPFVVTGALLALAALFIFFIMPKHITETSSSKKDSQKSNSTKHIGILDLLKIQGILLAAFGVFAAASSTGFVNATLEPHVRQFDLTPFEVGVVFVIYGAVYAVSAPMWGRVCDKMTQPKFITLIGGICNFVAFVLIGPAPFLPFDSNIWIICIGLILHGLALGATFVSGFCLSLRYAITAQGFPDNMQTYGLVSGMWTSVLSLGMFFGPVVGGALLEYVGFRWGSVFVLAAMLLLIVLIIIFLMKNGIYIRPMLREEDVPEAEQPLLKGNSPKDMDTGIGETDNVVWIGGCGGRRRSYGSLAYGSSDMRDIISA